MLNITLWILFLVAAIPQIVFNLRQNSHKAVAVNFHDRILGLNIVDIFWLYREKKLITQVFYRNNLEDVRLSGFVVWSSPSLETLPAAGK